MSVKMQGKERGANIDSRKGGEIGHEGQNSKSFRRAGQKSKAATTTTQAFVGLKDELQLRTRARRGIWRTSTWLCDAARATSSDACLIAVSLHKATCKRRLPEIRAMQVCKTCGEERIAT